LQLLFFADMQITLQGALLAGISGAVTSGLGYVIWYTAIRGLSVSFAATVQLSVPALAAFGGVMWLGEDITLRLLIATVLTLGGIAIVLRARAPG
jgi:drug/metabolite transporter (DMT)-like permease